MYVGTLNEITIDKTSKFLIESSEEEFCSLLEEDTPTSPSNNPDAMKHFIANVKRICLTKPKNWLRGMLKKLNRLAARIAVYEETKPGERSIWSKIKASLGSLIVSITKRIHSFLGREDEYVNDNKRVNKDITKMKRSIDRIKDSKQKTMHTLLNKKYHTAQWAHDTKELDSVINTRSRNLASRIKMDYSK